MIASNRIAFRIRGAWRGVAVGVSAAAIAITMSGCAFIERNVSYDFKEPGGLVGHYANNLMPAPTKDLEVYRAVVAFTYFSAVGSRFASTSEDARALYSYMVSTSKDLDNLAGHLAPGSCKLEEACPSGNYHVLFESDLPILEEHLFKLAVAALPKAQAGSVIDELVKGQYLAAIVALAKAAGEIIQAGHYVAADYRSEREIFAQIVAISQTGKSDDTLYNTALAQSYIDKMALDPAVFVRIQVVPVGAYRALYNLINAGCHAIQSKYGPPMGDVAKECSFQLNPNVNRLDYKPDKAQGTGT